MLVEDALIQKLFVRSHPEDLILYFVRFNNQFLFAPPVLKRKINLPEASVMGVTWGVLRARTTLLLCLVLVLIRLASYTMLGLARAKYDAAKYAM